MGNFICFGYFGVSRESVYDRRVVTDVRHNYVWFDGSYIRAGKDILQSAF